MSERGDRLRAAADRLDVMTSWCIVNAPAGASFYAGRLARLRERATVADIYSDALIRLSGVIADVAKELGVDEKEAVRTVGRLGLNDMLAQKGAG